MSATINIPAYSDALVVLGTAGVIVPLVHRWGISPILGYLAAGALLGPFGLGSFIGQVPLLYWLTVVDAKNVAGIADLGVVFLLFLIGLELSYERLRAMRRLVFGLGTMQVSVTTAALALGLALLGSTASTAIVLGSCLALSSTAIVLEVLSNQDRLTTSAGRASFAVLLAQDLAVIPILMFISILGAERGGSVLSSIGGTLVHAVGALAIIVIVGRLLLRPLFRLVARTQSNELFIAAILFVIVATALIAAVANLSTALGAFVAGLLLAETEYRKAVEATLQPFKGLLLGIFFFTVGMSIDARELVREPVLLTAAVAGLVVVKAAILIPLARAYKHSWAASIKVGLLLGPAGEFAFIGIGLAGALGLLHQHVASFTLAVTSLSMALIPTLAAVAERLERRWAEPRKLDASLTLAPQQQSHHAIVIGHGRVGKVVCQLLASNDVTYTAVDADAVLVPEDRSAGHSVYFGDATDPGFLKACGLMAASGVIVTISQKSVIDEVVEVVRQLRPDILVVARARDEEHACHLYAKGVTDAVPETVEASLQLSEAALFGFGVPSGKVIASIHSHRDEYRRLLQLAAHQAGREGKHNLRTGGGRERGLPKERD